MSTTLVTFLLLASCVAELVPSRARADTHPAFTSEEAETYLWAARACYLEATWRESDCVALLYVTRKRARRAERPWLDMLHDYSAIDAKTPRAEETRAFPWGDIPNKSARFNRRWQRLRNLVVEFAQGRHPNPCPHAVHWGGTMDHAKGRMVRARCAVPTVNTFYVLKK
jgi:hypothetical protein